MVLFLLTFAFPAMAQGGRFLAPAGSAPLEAGSRVDVRWEGVPPGVEEMELLISLDLGRNFARVGDLKRSATSRSWRVPSLPTRHAVLAIRARLAGEERVLFQTPAFTIEQPIGLPVEPLSYHGSELWTDRAGRSGPVSNAGLAGSHPAGTVDAQADAGPVEDVPDADLVAPPDAMEEAGTGRIRPVLQLLSERSQAPVSFPRRE